jgi:hypothetical protein
MAEGRRDSIALGETDGEVVRSQSKSDKFTPTSVPARLDAINPQPVREPAISSVRVIRLTIDQEAWLVPRSKHHKPWMNFDQVWETIIPNAEPMIPPVAAKATRVPIASICRPRTSKTRADKSIPRSAPPTKPTKRRRRILVFDNAIGAIGRIVGTRRRTSGRLAQIRCSLDVSLTAFCFLAKE